MLFISNCPLCGASPRFFYVCGEYFIVGSDSCPVCGRFLSMYASVSQLLSVWNSFCDSFSVISKEGDS